MKALISTINDEEQLLATIQKVAAEIAHSIAGCGLRVGELFSLLPLKSDGLKENWLPSGRAAVQGIGGNGVNLFGRPVSFGRVPFASGR